MRLKFFPGSELGPSFLLGEIIDLDRPQHVVANVMVKEEKLNVKIIVQLEKEQQDEVHAFAEGIDIHNVTRIQVADIMQYTSRRKSMC